MSKQKNLIEASQNVTFDTSGNVGIGTSSPSLPLHVFAGSNNTSVARFTGAQLNRGLTVSTYSSGGLNDGGVDLDADNSFSVTTNGSEAMRIDSSGNVLVGTTDSVPGNNGSGGSLGIALQGGEGQVEIASNGSGLIVNRMASDGEIAVFRKDGSQVGEIGVYSGNVYIYGSSGLRFTANSIVPVNSNGSNSDNDQDLGSAGVRFDDVYATNGTIQTSDQNEKQQIASLTTAEMDAAKAISGLFKTFKWNDSVDEKGDAARTHAGVIAQEVEQAMTDAGLDAGDYAFFISTTWWETQTDVPAVEADPENDVEAKDAYTRTDTYETLAEAPAGATERTRKGIRYPELLSFVGAATEQRLADIETRLTALEAV